MIANDEYDYERINDEFRKHPRARDKSWLRGLIAGLVLGVTLCTGTTYAIYAGELAYESAQEFQSPAPHPNFDAASPSPAPAPQLRPQDPRQPGYGYPRPRRGWGNARSPQE